jgi:hypothetical protein
MPAILPALLGAGVLALTVGESNAVRTPSPSTSSSTASQAPKASQSAAAPDPCRGPERRQFDFWLGEWEVREGGKVAGSNRIRRILGGCAVREEWTGAGGGNGTSLNVYDAARRRWHQTWVDDKGNVLLLEGDWRGGKMVLEGERPVPGGAGGGKTTRERISWTPKPGGLVRQLWESSADAGKTWQVAFDGTYSPKRS